MNDPLGPADDLVRLGICHFEPVTTWFCLVPRPLSFATLGDGRAFEGFPEGVQGFAVSFVCDGNDIGQLTLGLDFG